MVEMESYASISPVRAQERKNKSLCSIIYKEQIDVNKAGIWCMARWNDWGFFIDDHCFLWHVKCHTKIDLPNFRYFNDWRTYMYKCVITPSTHEYFDNYPEDDYFCTISLFFNEESYCLICAPPHYKKWVKVKLYDDILLLDAVSFCKDEKICTLFRNGKLGIIQMVPELSTCLSPVTFSAPTDANTEYQMIQLVSRQDQLFLVQQKFGSPSVLEVWKADFETQQFNRVFNLDGFIIFLSQGFSVAISSSLPQEKNHVYFTQNNDHCTLYAFHIGDQSVSPTKQFRIFNRQNSIPLIARSVCAKNIDSSTGKGKVKKLSSSSECGVNTTVNCRNSNPADNNICVHLTLDLQKEISRYLLSQDAYMNFRLVCKLWRSIAPPLRWKVVDHAAPPPAPDQESMWFLSLNQNDGLCTFYNPFRKLNCYMSNHDLVGCEIRYAKDGWLLVSKGKSLFFVEPSPSSKKIIHLPQRTEDYLCDTLSFSASPTDSSAWVIFGITCLDLSQVRISYLRAGDDKWTSMTMDNEVSFLLSCCSPVYFGEQFCVISFDGNVGTFGFLKDGSPYWVIHEFFLLYSPRFSSSSRLFLVQRDQNMLYSVIVTQQQNVRVYELDFGGDERVKLVKEVKNWHFFISETSSVAVCGMNVNVDDSAVFFPSFNVCNDYIYYSLEDAVFKVLKDNGTHKGQQKELLNRVWIRCELAPFYHQPHCKAEQNISMVADD